MAASAGGAVDGKPALGGLLQHARDARVRVLHVVDRVVVGLLPGELEVEVERLVVRAHHVDEARGVVADLGAQLPERHELRLALAHGDLLAALPQRDELDHRHLERFGRLAHRREPRAHARDVAVMVGAEDRHQQVEAALALVEVVGDVGSEVGLLPVGAHHDAVLLVAEERGPEPGRAVLLEHVAVRAQAPERAVDRPAVLARRRGPAPSTSGRR